jgi:hypothetical protein
MAAPRKKWHRCNKNLKLKEGRNGTGFQVEK